MSPRGPGSAQSIGVWAMQEEFQGGVNESVRGEMSKTDSSVRLLYPDLFTWYLIKLHGEGIEHPERSISQTAGIRSLMCPAEMSSGTISYKTTFGICYVIGKKVKSREDKWR